MSPKVGYIGVIAYTGNPEILDFRRCIMRQIFSGYYAALQKPVRLSIFQRDQQGLLTGLVGVDFQLAVFDFCIDRQGGKNPEHFAIVI